MKQIVYKTNGILTTETMTKWYFGEKFVKASIASAKKTFEKTGKTVSKFWQSGTGYLTIELH